ncbi:hypothetical protein AB0N24_24820 [Arthrobacter sp. NPDC093128]|uniref:hypothetical protein n=1 Tax=Arthrobacter sp. NPDC093128 TaxID=3154979 RepID=UPI003442ACF9
MAWVLISSNAALNPLGCAARTCRPIQLYVVDVPADYDLWNSSREAFLQIV